MARYRQSQGPCFGPAMCAIVAQISLDHNRHQSQQLDSFKQRLLANCWRIPPRSMQSTWTCDCHSAPSPASPPFRQARPSVQCSWNLFEDKNAQNRPKMQAFAPQSSSQALPRAPCIIGFFFLRRKCLSGAFWSLTTAIGSSISSQKRYPQMLFLWGLHRSHHYSMFSQVELLTAWPCLSGPPTWQPSQAATLEISAHHAKQLCTKMRYS